MARDERAKMYSVGAELTQMTKSDLKDNWTALIARVRRAYPEASGRLTFSLGGSLIDSPVWQFVDVAGIDAYPHLGSDAGEQPMDVIVERWNEQLGWSLGNFSARNNDIPVLLQETGICSVDGAMARPSDWQWCNGARAANQTEQALFYEATLRATFRQPWFAGVFFWKWTTDPSQGGPSDTHFTPHGKQAEGIMRQYFRA